MLKAPIPLDEIERLKKLYAYQVLDTPTEKAFDDLTELAAMICGTRISLVSLIDEKRQWFKSRHGLEASETPRDISFCGHAIMGDELFIVEDAEKDERFNDNPLFTGEPHVRFYAGFPLKTPEGYRVGTLCVIDSEVKKLARSQKVALEKIASTVVRLLEMRNDNKKLQDLSLQYLNVQKIVKAGDWELEIKTGKTIWSESIYDIYALAYDTPIKKVDAISYYAPHERAKLTKLLEESITNQTSFSEKFEFIDAKGNFKWVQSTCKPVQNDKGEVTKLIGTFQDVTEIVKKEKDLELVLSNITEGYFDWFIDKDYEYMSPKFWEILGYDPHLKTHHPSEWQKLMHPEDLPKALDLFNQHVSSQGAIPFDIEIRYLHQDGQWVWIICRGKVIEWSEDKRPLRMVGTHQDINEAKLKKIVETSISKVRKQYIEDQYNLEHFFNFLLQEILALTQSEYGFIGKILEEQGQKYLKSYALTDISWDEPTRNFYQTHAPQGLEFRNLNTLFGEVIKTQSPLMTNEAKNHPKAAGIPKGHPPLNKFMGVPLIVANQMIAMVGVANRASDYDEKFYALLKPFFDVCAEMLHAIELETEIENQKRLAVHQARLASIGELAAGVGHEINNPLAIIKGHLEILKRQIQNKNFDQELMLDKLAKADHGIERVANIVKGLRSFARADEEERKATNFSELLTSSLELISEIYKKLGIEIIPDIAEDVWIDGHKGRLQQVIMNLLSNSKDALEITPTKRIYVSLKKQQNQFELKIEDSGTGIPDNIKPKIFDAFFTTKPINKGTGIGLSISNSIVQEHHGEILLQDSNLGGAKFILHFPLLKSLADSNARDLQSKEPADNKSSLKNGKILIVEDEEEIRDLMIYMLDELGFETYGCENAIEAIKQVEAGKTYDLLLTDYQMPKMNGLELIAILKEKYHYQGKTCLVTGGVQMQENGFHHLVDDVLMKPFSHEDLKKIINRLL